MRAKDVMTHRVISVAPTSTVLQAASLMLHRRVSGLPVVDKVGGLVGIVTEGDLLRRAELKTEKHRPRWIEFLLGPGRAAEEFTRTHARKVDEIMTPDPYTVTGAATLEEVVTLMERRKIKRVPVVSDGKVVGIISRANLLKALLQHASYAAGQGKSDKSIREKILAQMKDSSWAPTACVDVNVLNGVVTLTGTIVDERDRMALKVLAENVPGVSAIKDDLVWIEPCSGLILAPEEEVAQPS